MIRHSALFRLSHESGSDAETAFLSAIADLARIPGVKDFQVLREISPKNNFDFAVAMSFENLAAYDAYNVHPVHVAFVRDRWIAEIADFMEHDTVAL